jgi:PAS domain S-box-containing protein
MFHVFGVNPLAGYIIHDMVGEAVGLERCSVLLVESSDGRSLVLASSDSPDVDRLEIDLSRYPEVRRAIERREPVLIQDVQNHPLMDDVRHFISDAGFNTILVVPMIHQDDLVGTLLLRAASAQTQFSPRTVAFCEAIASASANAVKNALLYRQVRDESTRHRATIETLENVLQHSMDLIVTTDLEGRITDFNRSAEQSLGDLREEILGEPLTRIYTSAGDRSEFLSSLRGKGRIQDSEATMRARDGSGRIFDLTVSVVRNELGEVVGSVCVGKPQYAMH